MRNTGSIDEVSTPLMREEHQLPFWELNKLFHSLWGAAKAHKDYDKTKWMQLQAKIESLKKTYQALEQLADDDNWFDDAGEMEWLDPERGPGANLPKGVFVRENADQYAKDKLREAGKV